MLTHEKKNPKKTSEPLGLAHGIFANGRAWVPTQEKQKTKKNEPLGLYILHILGEKYGKHRIGLYGDDGLDCFEYTRGPEADRIRKDFINTFKEDFNLSITCETTLKAVNFLAITLNLITGKYQPYNKPVNNPLYINILSNPPPNIIRNLRSNISRQINIQLV